MGPDESEQLWMIFYFSRQSHSIGVRQYPRIDENRCKSTAVNQGRQESESSEIAELNANFGVWFSFSRPESECIDDSTPNYSPQITVRSLLLGW